MKIMVHVKDLYVNRDYNDLHLGQQPSPLTLHPRGYSIASTIHLKAHNGLLL